MAGLVMDSMVLIVTQCIQLVLKAAPPLSYH